MTDTNKLKELAERATPGPWQADQLAVTADTRTQVCCGQAYMECCGDPEIEGEEFDPVCSATSEPLADFIAAANPQAILGLIAEVERLRKDAERYRWLRDLPRGTSHGDLTIMLAKNRPAPNQWCTDTIRGESLDAAIDAALEGGGR